VFGPGQEIARLLPVPRMSPAGFSVFSEIITDRQPSRALCDAVAAGRVPAEDLPEMIAYISTRDDSPTSGVSEADWLTVFRGAGFFSWPPVVVRKADGSADPLRPSSPVTLHRGSTAERSRRMSWSFDHAMAVELGRRHSPYGAAPLYKSTVTPTWFWPTWNAATTGAGPSSLTLSAWRPSKS
jgi:hypothetical protein